MLTKLDGGLSTALENNGNKLNTSLWTGEMIRTNPGEIIKAHLDFINAGAQIIISSSYQLSFAGCSKRGWSDEQTQSALIKSTQLAKDAVLASGKEVKVAASIGPYGAHLADGSEYKGNYNVSKSIIKDFHARRLAVLLSTNPDLLALETMPDTFEVEVLLDLLKDSPVPFWISYSCKEGNQTNAGQSFADAVNLSQSAMAVGINCTKPELISDLLGSAKSEKPFIVYPNAGRVWDAKNKLWNGEGTQSFSKQIIYDWVSLGAEIIGGCCGVGPNEIAEIALPINKVSVFIKNDSTKMIQEPMNNLTLKSLLTKAETDGLISVTEVQIDGRHKRLITNSKLRTYFLIAGDISFVIDLKPVVRLLPGDVLTIAQGSEYELFGTGKYLVINTPAFEAGDDTYL